MEILGIDVGGTGVKGAIVDIHKGELVTERYRLLTPKPATQPALIETIENVIQHFNWHGSVGIGFPAAVKNEIVKTASKIDDSWIGVNASAQIERETGCPTHIVNDADAAGYAEVEFGVGKNVKGTIIMAAFGTGIGTALFHNHQLVPNTELGHIPLHGMDAEDYAANSIREKFNMSWEEWGGRVNEYLQLLVDLFWPDLIIVGGGVSKSFHLFEPYINVDSTVLPAESRNHAGIIGAALSTISEHRLQLQN